MCIPGIGHFFKGRGGKNGCLRRDGEILDYQSAGGIGGGFP